jgi:hypothetical protein
MSEQSDPLHFLGVVFGLFLFFGRFRGARIAVEEQQRLTGALLSERFYVFGFKYGGLAIAIVSLLRFLGML